MTTANLTARGYADLCSVLCKSVPTHSAGHTASHTSDAARHVCTNCDAASEEVYYYCWDCSSNTDSEQESVTDAMLTHSDAAVLCQHCALQLHTPKKSFQHHMTLIHHPILQFLPTDTIPLTGYGFCRSCLYYNRGMAVLATLYCEQCEVNLCMACDSKQHNNQIECSEHNRLWIVPSQTIQKVQLTVVDRTVDIYYNVDLSSYAGIVWDGTIFLAQYLTHLCQTQQLSMQNKRVIELGCGVAALPSVASWMLGAKEVVATDLNEDALELLQRTVNGVKLQPLDIASSGTIRTQQFSFGADVQPLQPTYDIILGSFLLYIPELFDSLARSIYELGHADSIAYFSSHERQREPAFIKCLAAYNLQAERIDIQEFIRLQQASKQDDTALPADIVSQPVSNFDHMRDVTMLKITRTRAVTAE